MSMPPYIQFSQICRVPGMLHHFVKIKRRASVVLASLVCLLKAIPGTVLASPRIIRFPVASSPFKVPSNDTKEEEVAYWK